MLGVSDFVRRHWKSLISGLILTLVIIVTIPIIVTIYSVRRPSVSVIRTEARDSSCHIDLDDSSQWPGSNPPIILAENGSFLLPAGSEGSRSLVLAENNIFILGCSGSEFSADGSTAMKTGICDAGDLLVEDQNVGSSLADFECQHQPDNEATVVGSCGPDGAATLIQINFDVMPSQEGEAVTITACLDTRTAASLWAKSNIFDEVRAQDHGGSRPSFRKGTFYDFDVNNFYKMATQKETMIELVGSEELADKYIGDQSSQLFLSRGHLAPNADFIFESWKDSSFWFVNVAPQWQSFNGRNWATFEDDCRQFAVSRNLDLEVYTGTSGVIELKDVRGDMVPIYLYNRDQLPVPRYYWKILHDPVNARGVAVIGINNPHLEEEPTEPELIPCPPLASHPLLAMSEPHNIKYGYMFACRVEDWASAAPEVPQLPAMSLLE